MSKAFTKESEAEADFEDELPALPAGTKNYITPEGLQRLDDEFAQLQKIERTSQNRRDGILGRGQWDSAFFCGLGRVELSQWAKCRLD